MCQPRNFALSTMISINKIFGHCGIVLNVIIEVFILSLFCLPSLTCVSPYVVYTSVDLRHKDACATEWFAALAGPVSTFVTVLLPLSETQYRFYQEISWIEGWVVQARRIDIWYTNSSPAIRFGCGNLEDFEIQTISSQTVVQWPG